VEGLPCVFDSCKSPHLAKIARDWSLFFQYSIHSYSKSAPLSLLSLFESQPVSYETAKPIEALTPRRLQLQLQPLERVGGRARIGAGMDGGPPPAPPPQHLRYWCAAAVVFVCPSDICEAVASITWAHQAIANILEVVIRFTQRSTQIRD
jgi:hypothetical protein